MAMGEANRQGASRILLRAHGQRGIVLGLLNQRRLVDRFAGADLRATYPSASSRCLRIEPQRMTRPVAEGAFALGVSPDRFRLPHPRLGLPVLLLVHQVLIRAFALLRESGSLENKYEDEITAALRSRIENDLRQSGEVRGFSRRTFDSDLPAGPGP